MDKSVAAHVWRTSGPATAFVVTIVGLAISLLRTPSWAGLLVDKVGYLCPAQNMLTAGPELCGSGRDHVVVMLGLTVITIAAGAWLVWVAREEMQLATAQGVGRLLRASVVALSPVLVIVLLATSPESHPASELGIVVGLMLLAAIAAMCGGLRRLHRLMLVFASGSLVLHIVALVIAPDFAPVSILAISALVAAIIRRTKDSAANRK